MFLTLKTIATIGFVLVSSLLFTSTVMAQEAPATVKEGPAVIQYNGDMANILSHLPSVYGRTIGLEIDPRQPRSTVGFDLRHPTLADVLNAITKSAPIYQWSEKGSFIEVVPVGGGSPFLDTRISNFHVDYADPAEAINQLMNLPEVQAVMNLMRLRYQDLSGASATPNSKKMSFTVQNVTLREVLNKIADENGSRFWTLKRNGAGVISISIAPISGH